MLTTNILTVETKSQQILVTLSIATLLLSIVAFLGTEEWLNSFVIFSGSLMTILGFVAIIPYCLGAFQIGKLLFLLGVIMTFWFGACRSMIYNYVPQSGLIFGELGGYWPPKIIALAVLYIVLFQCSGLVGYRFGIFPRKIQEVLLRNDRKDRSAYCILPYLLIILMLLTLLRKYGGTVQGFINGLVQSRTIRGKTEDLGLLVNFVWIGYYGITVITLRVILRQIKPWERFLLPLAAIALATVCMDGTRHHLLYIAMPVFLVLLHLSIRKNTKYLKVLAVIILLFLVVYQGQSLSRDISWDRLSSVDFSEFTKVRGTDQFPALAYAIVLVPERQDYFCTPATLFFFTHWVPRSIWASKPYQPETMYLSDEWTGGADYRELNITPSVIGQYHMNWGVFGVIWIGFFFGWMFKCIDLRLSTIEPFMYTHLWAFLGMFMAFLIASFRHFSPIYFMFPLFGFVWFIFCTVASIRRTAGANESPNNEH